MIHSHGSILRYGLALMAASMMAMVGAPTALAQRSSSATSDTATSPVDVNNADLKTLETLPGVGPTLAKRIVSGRPYQSLSDLAQVKGMGKTKANSLKGHVTFGAASSSTGSAKTAKSHTKSSGSSTASSSEESTTPSPTGRSSTGSKPSSSTRLAPGQTVDINTASAEELDKVPGIGPTKAQAIVDYRNEHGNFKSIDDIKNVHGIKEGTFSKMKDYITVGQ